MQELQAERTAMETRHPRAKDAVKARFAETEHRWAELESAAVTRRSRLLESGRAHRFLAAKTELFFWVKGMRAQIEASPSSSKLNDMQSVELEIQSERHEQIQLEINSKLGTMRDLADEGAAIAAAATEASVKEAAEVATNEIASVWEQLSALAQAQSVALRFGGVRASFMSVVDGVRSWLDETERAVKAGSPGNSLAEVDLLLHQQAEFRALFVARAEQLDRLPKLIAEAHAESHPLVAQFEDLRRIMVDKHLSVQNELDRRQTELDGSRLYFRLIREIEETSGWLSERVVTAKDGAHLDPTNLRSKMGGHDSLVLEINAYESEVTGLQSRAAKALADGSHGGRPLDDQIATLSAKWDELKTALADRGRLLREANAGLQLSRLFDDNDAWCAQTELALENTDLGGNILDSHYLQKRHKLLEEDVVTQGSRIRDCKDQMQTVTATGNFRSKDLQSQFGTLEARYAAVRDSTVRRGDELADSFRHHALKQEANVLSLQLNEKANMAASTEVGESLADVQSLVKRHRVLEAEVVGCTEQLAALRSKETALAADTKQSMSSVQQCLDSIDSRLTVLKNAMQTRFNLLASAERAQSWFGDQKILESWMSENEEQLQSKEYGDESESSYVLLMQHEELHSQLFVQTKLVATAAAECKDMLRCGLPESPELACIGIDRLRTAGSTLDAKMAALIDAAAKRGKLLRERNVLHEVMRDHGDAMGWIRDQLAEVSSDYVGKDSQECEMLQDKCSSRSLSIQNSERENYEFHIVRWRKLSSEGHSGAAELDKMITSLEVAWDKLIAAVQTRSTLLLAAHVVHTFNLEADDVLAQISAKLELATVKGVGQDVRSCEVLTVAHEAVRRDSEALKLQVATLSKHANELSTSWPTKRDVVFGRFEEVNGALKGLMEAIGVRERDIQLAGQYFKYANEVDERKRWIHETESTIVSDPVASDVKTAEALRAAHRRLASEVQAQSSALEQAVSQGRVLIANGHPHGEELAALADDLAAAHDRLKVTEASRARELELSFDYESYLVEVRNLESRNARHHAILNCTDVGASLGEVAELISRHQEHCASRRAQAKLTKSMVTIAQQLLEQKDRKNKTEVMSRRDAVCADDAELDAKAATRGANLDISQQSHQLVRDTLESTRWLDNAMETAKDEGFKDLLNLHAHEVQHELFQGEVHAYEATIVQLTEKSKLLATKTAAGDVAELIAMLNKTWTALGIMTSTKARTIKQAVELAKFNREADKLEEILQTRAAIAAETSGGDSEESIGSLLKAWADFELLVAADRSRFEDITAMAQALETDKNFSIGTVETRMQANKDLWTELQERMTARESLLLRSRQLELHLATATEVTDRLKAKIEFAEAFDNPKDIGSADSLIKRHEALVRDCKVLSQSVTTLLAASLSLQAHDGLKADRLHAASAELKRSDGAMNAAVAALSSRLVHGREVQLHFERCRDCVSWIQERRRLTAAVDGAGALSGASQLLKRHAENKAALEARRITRDSLLDESHRLTACDTGVYREAIGEHERLVASEWAVAEKVVEEKGAALVLAVAERMRKLREKITVDDAAINTVGNAAESAERLLGLLQSSLIAQMETSMQFDQLSQVRVPLAALYVAKTDILLTYDERRCCVGEPLLCSRNSLSPCFSDMPVLPTDPQMDMFASADTDGDGLVSLEEAKAQGMSEALFRSIDNDGNGQLTQEEFARWMQGDHTARG